MSQPTLSTYGGMLHEIGYAGELVDENLSTVESLANDQAQPILFGQAVARSAANNTCKAPASDADLLIGISLRFPIRPTSGPSVGGTNVVQYSQYDACPVCREGWIYCLAAENVSRGDKVVSITAGHGTLGSEANNQGPLGTVSVTLPTPHAASGTINIVTNPANSDTITIYGTAITFATTGNGTTSVTIGLSPAATCTALAVLLSASSIGNIPKATYADDGNGTITVTSVALNTGANAFTLATSVDAKIHLNGSVQASTTLAGGLGNVGNGVLTPDATTPVLTGAIDGIYHAECIAASGGGGTFRVYDPNGNEIAADFAVGATFQTQIKFVIAAGNVDFVVGDAINVKVNAAGATGRVTLPYANWETTTLQGAIGIVRIHN